MDLVIVRDATIEKPYGWIVFYTSRRFAETGDILFAAGGNGPYVVQRDGTLVALGTARPVEDEIRRFEAARLIDLSAEAIDRFVTTHLAEAGAWCGPDASGDGTQNVRIVARSDPGASVCGRIWEIGDQSLHTFWLDLEVEVEALLWTLHFDLVPTGSPRRDRDAAELLERADDAAWTITLRGVTTRRGE